jgi:hypothetical protein
MIDEKGGFGVEEGGCKPIPSIGKIQRQGHEE